MTTVYRIAPGRSTGISNPGQQLYWFWFILIITGCFTIVPVNAQEAAHNRVAVQDKTNWKSQPGIEVTLLPLQPDANQGIVALAPYADILLENTWRFSCSLPLYLSVPLSISGYPSSTFAPGDGKIEAAWLIHRNIADHTLSLSWTVPSGFDAEQALEHNSLMTSRGYHAFDLSWQYTRYTDPISLDSTLTVSSTLPKKYQEGTCWEPLAVQIESGTTILMNRFVAFRLGLYQTIELPPLQNYHWLYEQLYYTVSGSFSLIYTQGNQSVAFRLLRGLNSTEPGITLSLVYSYTIKPHQKESTNL